jgi:malate dehydrogenase (oxaloacetate-decarboxylating)(NADP+)
VRGEPYDELIDEFIEAAKRCAHFSCLRPLRVSRLTLIKRRRWGSTVLFQFEDFGNENGRRLLEQYRGETCAFNDDIQGTAAAMLGGILAAMPLLKGGLGDQTFLFAGAGETGTGMADLLACAISRVTRQPLTEARKRIWLFDSKGLVTRERAQNLEVRHLVHALPADGG